MAGFFSKYDVQTVKVNKSLNEVIKMIEDFQNKSICNRVYIDKQRNDGMIECGDHSIAFELFLDEGNTLISLNCSSKFPFKTALKHNNFLIDYLNA